MTMLQGSLKALEIPHSGLYIAEPIKNKSSHNRDFRRILFLISMPVAFYRRRDLWSWPGMAEV